MPTKWTVTLLACLTLLLSACEFTVSGTVEPTEPQPRPVSINVDTASYATNYQAIVNGNRRFVICDDRTTELGYEFRYSGRLNSWTSLLRGNTTGTEAGRRTFDSSQITEPGLVKAIYEIRATNSPLLTEGPVSSEAELSTQGIVVTPDPSDLGPRRPIGYTDLIIRVNGSTGRGTSLVSDRPIPVIANCN